MQPRILQIETNATTLRTPSRKLTLEEITSPTIQSLIQEMKQIMQNAPGVGLAAPQIGINIQLAVIEDPIERVKGMLPHVLEERGRKPVVFHVVINPEIIQLDGKLNRFFEGCLSVKGLARVTERFNSIRVKCLDEFGERKEIVASGWYARILQHEIDHLHGRLYIDVADARTEISTTDDEYKQKWLNATADEIEQFYQMKCK